eukprot:TRINITY_DN305_c0_g1_i1.p1 TRINITY_DN305_c0_g1~~TRINITY_DN305_c0_g1_i1.p1  ORF type:complete len:812 (-),score=219.14 TRINITY_DN305_c0_g1_i1:98-2422(-)
MSSLFSHVLGFPRIGNNRELKIATEKYWQGKISQDELLKVGKQIRESNWNLQKSKGIDLIPSNDFSFYDQILDACALFGAVPERFGWKGGEVDLHTYFAMGRGIQEKEADSLGNEKVFALEMLKWFDTNYHYMVPEFTKETSFSLSNSKIFDQFLEAKSLGIVTKPVLVGPLTFLLLGKTKQEQFDKLEELLPKLIPVYIQVIEKLSELGAQWIQLDEPYLIMDLTPKQKELYATTYDTISRSAREKGLKVLLATYFDDLGENLQLASLLPVEAVHLDLVRGKADVPSIIESFKTNDKIVSLGLVNGRNIWKIQFEKASSILKTIVDALGPTRVWVAPSCSLVHSPITLQGENKLDAELKSVLSFATEKLDEVIALKNSILSSEDKFAQDNAAIWKNFLAHPALNRKEVHDRISKLSEVDFHRRSKFDTRRKAQIQSLNLPAFPTTTIGSLPQTTEVRNARLKLKKGELTEELYDQFIQEKTKEGIRFQEEIGIDVLVTGEFERNDMVEYFGSKLEGFAFTEKAWVQSFGSRYVKPPIIWGDVVRTEAMTTKENIYAQSLTSKPVKGMLTGPVTILQWSFVREDQTRELTSTQIALAIRDEVKDLVNTGSKIVQVDEPAYREGLPVKKSRWEDYLRWASKSFRLSTSGEADEIQIHTHMCYAEFSDIIDSIIALDADVISFESSRSQMKLLGVFANPIHSYPNEIGPGVFDIHSPKVPSQGEMESLLREACKVIKADQVWVNPDCGLKTRSWVEVKQQLTNMVEAAKVLRNQNK